MSISDYVHDRGLYTLTDAAKLAGRSTDTVRRWINDGRVSEPEMMYFGRRSFPVFSAADVAKIKAVADGMKLGRPVRGFTPAVRKPGTQRLIDNSKEQ